MSAPSQPIVIELRDGTSLMLVDVTRNELRKRTYHDGECRGWKGDRQSDGAPVMHIVAGNGRTVTMRALRVAVAFKLGVLRARDVVLPCSRHGHACINAEHATVKLAPNRFAGKLMATAASIRGPESQYSVERVRAALDATQGNITRAAEALGCSREHMRRMMKRTIERDGARVQLSAYARELRRAARGFEGAGRPPARGRGLG
jgi:hypothetical protein